MEIFFNNYILDYNLSDKNKIFSMIYNGSSDIMFIVSVDAGRNFTYLSVNNMFAKAVGLSKIQCIGRNMDDLIFHDFAEEMITALQDVAIKKERFSIEINFKFKSKNRILDTFFSPISDKSGNCIYILVIAKDITDQKKREEELIFTRIKAEESSRLKTSLLANMSHELRTPLNGILGFADLLLHEPQNPEAKQWADYIIKSGKRLLSTFHSILELSRLEAERVEVYNNNINVQSILNEIFEKYLPETSLKNLSFTVDIKSSNLKLHLDESLFKQIIDNLVNNAVKFTRHGGISILVEENCKNEKSYIEIMNEALTGIMNLSSC